MEVFAKYGTQAQKDKWLKPLLNGEIRSAFLMTEPQIAASDATNIEMSMHKEGNEWVLNGQVSHCRMPLSLFLSTFTDTLASTEMVVLRRR